MIKQAADKGIVVVAVDQAVTAPEAYVLTNDQVEYAKLGAKWLFDKLGGKGSVVEMRGIDGVPADADRHQGFTEVLKDYPDIKVTSVFSGWAQNKTAQEMKDLLASGKPIDGIWTSGIDSTVVDAYKTAGKPFVPVVGADNNGFIGQLIDMKGAGPLRRRGQQSARRRRRRPRPRARRPARRRSSRTSSRSRRRSGTTTTDTDKLKAAYNPKLDPYYSDKINMPPYTNFTMDQLIDLQGPLISGSIERLTESERPAAPRRPFSWNARA